ncbi:AraC family transcriptional regulator [Lapidilactobacillus wuchangensis]|uniref:AraC family transcriptional regulator n=1 Tax=Lapidilactobacillus wuchangensis TaxID=2486001 RepID=UPI000F78707C|nr:AraC family transcriptional regulator [Lapidilactobacillus wuchangensis]
MEEEILSFLPGQFLRPDIFFIELAGVTFPFANYHVQRPQSAINCLEYVIAGQGTIQLDQATYQAKAGQVYLLPQGHDHHYWSDPQQPWHKLWLNFRGTLPTSLLQAYGLLQQPLFNGQGLAPYFQELLRICRHQELTPRARTSAATTAFEALLQQLFLNNQIQTQIPMTVQQAQIYIDHHLNQPLKLPQLAQLVGLSPAQLTRQFQQVLAQTPYAYYLQQRLTMAQTLLRGTDLPIKVIADRLAFNDVHYFANLFKNKLGVTPYQWRQQNR